MMDITNTEFIERTMFLEGNPWRFTDRPYIFPIINDDPWKLVLMTGRQSEKSTSTAGKHIASACRTPHQSSLYINPTMTQTSVYSRKKIDAVFEQSPLLKGVYWPGSKGFSVTEKRLKNNHTMYFRSAYHDADTIRGLTSDRTFIDERQDIINDCVPVIEECSSHRPFAVFMQTGTPKTLSNGLEWEWSLSTQNEWTIKCMHCGHWNILGITNVHPGKPGLWCQKCSKDIYTQNGTWISYGKSSAKAHGYRFPQIILPSVYINWEKLFIKMETYTIATLMNEVFGHSFDAGVKPITREQIAKCCDPDMKMELVSNANALGYEVYAGVDWGTGELGYTILQIGHYNPNINKMVVTLSKRYVGKEAEPEFMLQDMARKLLDNCVMICGVDHGFSYGLLDRLKSMVAGKCKIVAFQHTNFKGYVGLNKKGMHYVTNRTAVMTDTFEAIKQEFFKFPMWSVYESFANDFMNIEVEYNERMRTMKYDHIPTNPDDAFHSLLYLYVTYLIRVKKRAPQTYDPDRDEP